MNSDTIVAISTPAGVGGIAVARLSGSNALPLALRHLSLSELQPRHATYCRFDELDDVVVTWFPVGYTGESTVEISCHGSRYVQQALIDTFVADGARLAEAGEFTLRAFRNGRLNLSQAEAVADLIDAVTPAQHRLAVSQLRGGYAEKLKQLRGQLVDLTSLMELELDFSQEDVEFVDRRRLRSLVGTLERETRALVDSFKTGNALKQGIPVAIIGAPNVGKSTLLNALLGDDRAIVSDIPGTTRDTIDALLTIGGVTFRLIDTAGLRHTDDEVEMLGIQRSRKAQKEADIVVEVWGASDPYTVDYMSGTWHNDGKRHIRVINKCDLDENAWNCNGQQRGDTFFVCTSAKKGDGIEQLKEALAAAVPQTASDILLSNPRHCEALSRVATALHQVEEGMADGLPADLLVVDLRDALYHLGSITGDVTNDEVLGNIFSRFCIGK